MLFQKQNFILYEYVNQSHNIKVCRKEITISTNSGNIGVFIQINIVLNATRG